MSSTPIHFFFLTEELACRENSRHGNKPLKSQPILFKIHKGRSRGGEGGSGGEEGGSGSGGEEGGSGGGGEEGGSGGWGRRRDNKT